MKTLFDEISLAGIPLKNRLICSATWKNMTDEEGNLTDRLLAVYEKVAEGGVGAIVSGYAKILKEEQPNPKMLAIHDDSFIPGLKKLAGRMHELDTPIILQACYGGSQTNYNVEERIIWGPSAVKNPVFEVTPTPMTKENIQTVITAFANAARRAKESGFDGFQLHAAHGYLLSQFLTPFFNRRTDEYGGSIENRARIILESLDAVRKEVGDTYPVFIKMHCSDFMEEAGLTLEESLQVAKLLEQHGISGIEISGGHLSDDWKTSAMHKSILKEDHQSYFRNEAAQIAEAVSVPVIVTGGNRSPKLLDTVLNETQLTGFGLSRTLHSEPDMPARWRDGNLKRPRCISCNQCWHEDGNICVLDRHHSA